jgi:hypothetical protein
MFFNAASKRGLAMLNEMITEQAGVVAVIDQFKILMIAMLIVSPLVLLLCKSYVRGSPRWKTGRSAPCLACFR